MMKVALIGYGKMGKAIEHFLLEKGHSVHAKFSSSNPLDLDQIKGADVAIEFTTPEAAPSNIEFCLKNQVPVVVGSTAWHDHLEGLSALCEQHNGALLHASNFSIGVNLFFKMNEIMASIMNQHASYSPEITEIHHTEKLDSPSGTAITTAEGILTNFKSKKTWVNQATDNKEELGIVSLREPNVPGTHVVNYSSAIDSIELKHTAHKRDGFALGAILAAEWLLDKKGVFTMRDVLNF